MKLLRLATLFTGLALCLGFGACSSHQHAQTESEDEGDGFAIETEASADNDRAASDGVELGVWYDATSKLPSVEEIRQWMKPFCKAGITNFYICSSPQSIERYIEAANDFEGAKIHAWVFALNACNDPETFAHKDWFEVNRRGENSLDNPPYVKIYKWLSPAVPEVRQWVKNKMARYAALKGLASVHLDFIRFNDLFLGRKSQHDVLHIDQTTYDAKYDFGYHPKAIAAFKEQFGYSPLDLAAPYMSPEWIQFRMNEVTTLVNEIVADTHKKGVAVTAAVFPFPERARMMVLQDWPRWDVDAVCTMNYHTFYRENLNWHRFSVENGLQETRHRNKYIAGIFVSNMSADDIYRAAKMSIEAGADGINFFSAHTMKKDDRLNAAARLNKEYN